MPGVLPVQVLLNNLLCDVSEVGIPFDNVDEHELSQPHVWDLSATLRFTLIMGATSSVFDLATFAVLSQRFNATPETFRTAWFLESTAT
jgi:Mg2+-importing ATPase